MDIDKIINLWLRMCGMEVISLKKFNELKKYVTFVSRYVIITPDMHREKYIHYVLPPNKTYCYISTEPCKKAFDTKMVGLLKTNNIIVLIEYTNEYWYYWTYIPELHIFVAHKDMNDEVIKMRDKMEAYQLIDKLKG